METCKNTCPTARLGDDATEEIHSNPCPSCSCEPEVTGYLRDSVTKVRRGYYCACGAVVIDGILNGMSH